MHGGRATAVYTNYGKLYVHSTRYECCFYCSVCNVANSLIADHSQNNIPPCCCDNTINISRSHTMHRTGLAVLLCWGLVLVQPSAAQLSKPLIHDAQITSKGNKYVSREAYDDKRDRRPPCVLILQTTCVTHQKHRQGRRAAAAQQVPITRRVHQVDD